MTTKRTHKNDDAIKAAKATYIKPTEAAEIAGVSRQTIYQWLRDGRISSENLAGTIIYRPEFERFIEARKIFTGGAAVPGQGGE